MKQIYIQISVSSQHPHRCAFLWIHPPRHVPGTAGKRAGGEKLNSSSLNSLGLKIQSLNSSQYSWDDSHYQHFASLLLRAVFGGSTLYLYRAPTSVEKCDTSRNSEGKTEFPYSGKKKKKKKKLKSRNVLSCLFSMSVSHFSH